MKKPGNTTRIWPTSLNVFGGDVASLYDAKWEIELVSKELKDVYQSGQIQNKNPNVVKRLG